MKSGIALSVAAKGVKVVVLPGTYKEHINFGGKAITVTGLEGLDPCSPGAFPVIDSDGGGAAVQFNSGEGHDSVLSGFVITGGSSGEYAGAIGCQSIAPTISYTDSGIAQPGMGNIAVDPLFAQPGRWVSTGGHGEVWSEGDYHLKSEWGRWDPVGRDWMQDKVSSPCIDAGDPGWPVGLEPAPNGGRVNMGAYGGTTQASKRDRPFRGGHES